MKTYLIIFEGPWKFATVNKYKKDIEKILWWKVELAASFWHILTSPFKELWINIEEKKWKYDFKYKMTVWNRKAIKELESKINNTLKSWWKIIFATDQDRAGEMIAKEIVDYFKLKKWDYLRAPLSSVEKEDFLDLIKNWLKNELNKPLYEAEEVRMILDKLWWYVKSPILYSRLNDNDLVLSKIDKLVEYLENKKEEFISKNEKYLADSRVQNFLRRIDDIIKELNSYKIWKYWKKPLYSSSIWRVQLPMNKLIVKEWFKSFKEINAKNYIKLVDENTFKWNMNEKQIEQIKETMIQKVVNEIKEKWEIKITNVNIKRKQSKPKKPYNETSLVSDANSILWFSPKITSSITQKLYEKGITTYYRTKWNWYSDWSKKYLLWLLNKAWLKNDIDFKKDYPLAKDAWHDAIRPAFKWQIKLNKDWYYEPIWEWLNENEIKLFDLIYRNSLASLMKNATIEEIQLEWLVNNKYKFWLKINYIIEEWFIKMYKWYKKSITNLIDIKNKNEIIKKYSNWNILKIEDIILEEWKFQFNDLVSFNTFKNTLESKNIWTPATFIPIFDKIKERWYTYYDWKSKLLPLAKWMFINYLTNDIEVNDLDFTEQLLKQIEDIESWKLSKEELLNEIFKKYFIEAYKNYQNFTFKKSTKKWSKWKWNYKKKRVSKNK